ncbi:MAG: hypothetical protein AAFO77_07265, partial [Pseudomonadota bacterium]
MSTPLADRPRDYHIGVVAGEQSGQLLAADVMRHFASRVGGSFRLSGVGGGPLEELGLTSFFDPEDIALMGVTQVVGKLPGLVRRIRMTADRFAADPPDLVLLVDSPDFASRVAARLKAQRPDVPIAKYVAPTVWAWRPQRAAKMVATVDHVFALFPFEPDVMAQLGGPPTTYVGHRLLSDEALLALGDVRKKRKPFNDGVLRLAFLPGSRRSEIEALLPDMQKAATELVKRRGHVRVIIPAVERHERRIRDAVLGWEPSVDVRVVSGRDATLQAFAQADAAMAASGTVTLELALAGVPAISIYRVDLLMKPFKSMLTGWSAALPNIISDRVIIPEYYDLHIIPGLMARQLEEISDPSSHKHKAMMNGYAAVRRAMTLERPANETVVDVLLEMLKNTPRPRSPVRSSGVYFG